VNIPSLLRSLRKKFFGGTAPRRKPFRRGERLWIEHLETRLAPAGVLPPRIIGVTPADFRPAGTNTSNPPITIQFSEDMDRTDVQNVNNYVMFKSDGTPVALASVTYTNSGGTFTNGNFSGGTYVGKGGPGPFVATVSYSQNTILPAGDAYSLFVLGDHVRDATDQFALATQGQIATTNAGQSSVSTVTVASSGNVNPIVSNPSNYFGTLNAVQSYPIGPSVNSRVAPQLLVAAADFNGDGIGDVAVLNNTVSPAAIDIYEGTGNGNYTLATTITLTGLSPSDMVVYFETTGNSAGQLGPDIAVTDPGSNQVLAFINTTAAVGAVPAFSAAPGVTATFAKGGIPKGLVAADLDGDGNTDLAVVDTHLDTNIYKGVKASDWEIDVLLQSTKTPGTFLAPVGVTVGTQADATHFDQGLQHPVNLGAGSLRGPNVDPRDLVVTGQQIGGGAGFMELINTSSPGSVTFAGTYTIPPPAPGVAANFAGVTPAVGNSFVTLGQITHAPGSPNADDIVVSSLGGGVEVFPNVTGTGGLGSGTTIQTGIRLNTGVVLAPLGTAAKLGATEILFPNPNTNNFEVLPNLSSGGGVAFGSALNFAMDNGPYALAVADMNNDGIPDVVTANTGINLAGGPSGFGQSFSIARGDPAAVAAGKIGFLEASTAQETLTPTAAAPDAVAVGDVNGDGIPDLVVADSGLNQVEVYLGVAPALTPPPFPGSSAGSVIYPGLLPVTDPAYVAPAIYPVMDAKGHGQTPTTVALANLTGTFYLDPNTKLPDPSRPILDIVTGDYADNYISILANLGTPAAPTGTFSSKPTALPVGPGPTQVVPGLFDRNVTTLTGALTASQTSVTVASAAQLPTGGGFLIQVDSELMLVTSINGTALNVVRGIGGTFAVSHKSGAAVGKLAQDLVVSHNGTGSALTNQGVSVFLNANTGNRALQPFFDPLATQGKHATGVAAGDFNNDGNLDFVFTNAPTDGSAGTVTLMLGNGSGTFSQFANPYVVAPNLTAIAAADVNRDGYLDVIVGSSGPDTTKALGVLFNNVGSGFGALPIFSSVAVSSTVNATVQSLAVTDFADGNDVTPPSPTSPGNPNGVDPYPDLIVTPTPVAANAATPIVDGLIRLKWDETNKKFINAQAYEAGGPPSPVQGLPDPLPVAVVSDPLIRVVSFIKSGNIVETNLLLNGDFEAQDLSQTPLVAGEQGNLSGWQNATLPDSRGGWYVQTGTLSPLSQTSLINTAPTGKPDGAFQAMLDESNIMPVIPGGALGTPPFNPNVPASYNGTNFLYQDVTIPANVPTIQILTLTGGVANTTTFQLTFNGVTTPVLTYTGTAQDAVTIQDALNNLSSIMNPSPGTGPGAVTVTPGLVPGTWKIILGGGLIPFDQDGNLTAAIVSGPGVFPPDPAGIEPDGITTQQHGAGILSATLSLRLYLINTFTSWQVGPADPTTTLDYRTSQADQQVRVDLVNPNDPLFGDTTPFVDAPTVTFTGGGGTGAAGFATIVNGAITAVTITNPGNGYIAAPQVHFTGGGGNGATANVTLSGTQVGSVTVTNGGSGYTTGKGAVYQLPGRSQNTVFATDQGTALQGLVPITLTSNIDVSALAGKTVRLRIAATNNRGQLIVGVDDAKLQVTFSDATEPTATPPNLRNPGFLTGTNRVANTTDTTVTGRVNPIGADGGPANIQFVSFSFTDANGVPQVQKVGGPLAFDALGNYQYTLQGLPFGTNTITVTVVDKAGNSSTSTLTFFNQGPSLGSWQSVGPGYVTTSTNPTDPGSVGYATVSGRVTATVSDRSDPSGNTYYVGSVNGGVWRTTDGGADWTPLTDFLTGPSGQPIDVGVGAIALAKTNPANEKVVYVGTGVGDLLPDSRDGVGVLVSFDGGTTWQMSANSAMVLGPGPNGAWPGARITAMAVDPDTASTVYAAVAAGGEFGPGVYKSTDFGSTWTNVLTPTSMSLATGSTLASVTSLIIDPRNDNDITIGLGNIGMVPETPIAGIWKSTTFGSTWAAVLGGDDPNVPNNKVPSDLNNTGSGTTPFVVGRVTLAQGYGVGADIATFYALIGNPPSPYPTQFPFTTPGGTFNYGTGVVSATNAASLYKSSNGMLDWTKVMIRANVSGDTPNFQDVNLLGNDASNIGALVVDPTDPNVVYVGGADNYEPPAIGGPNNANFTTPQSPGLIRVDTGEMMDVFLAKSENYRTSETYTWGDGTNLAPVAGFNADLNNGDSIGKYVASLEPSPYGHNPNVYPSTDGGGPYGNATSGGEGVPWFDLESGTYSPSLVNQWEAPTLGLKGTKVTPQIPGRIDTFAIDGQGRVLVGTYQGVYRITYHGVGYDYTSGGFGIMTDTTVGVAEGDVPKAFVNITPLNGNLQISNLTSVATDPLVAGRYYAAGFDIGTMETNIHVPSVGLAVGWQSMGLQGGIGPYEQQVGNPSNPPVGGLNNDAGTVLTAPVDPTAPANLPTTVYVNYAYDHTAYGFDPEVSQNLGGDIGTFNPVKAKNAGISINDNATYLPVMVIDPVKVLDSGFYQDILAYGTDRIYTSRTSSNLWDDRVHRPLSTQGGLVTAIGIAPTNKDDNNQVFYVGSNLGEVWVDLHNGNDGWPLLNAGLPTAPVTYIAVSPVNPLVAYITFGGLGAYSHVWMTSNGGKTWQSIQGNLPQIPMYSFVCDPRSQPQAGAPTGHLYVATDVGVYVSVNGGSSWQVLGNSSLPHVPTVSLQFNPKLEELVIGTQGRGVFEISTDRIGARVVSSTPTTPLHAGATSVTVTFNKAIGKFPASALTITGPNGIHVTPTAILDVSVPQPGPLQINPHNTWEIDFAPLMADGTYTFSIGPGVRDQLNNPMDQNQNKVNGEVPGDIFNLNIAINTTDDGAFITGLYNDLIGHAIDTGSFINYLNLIDPARFGALPGIANSFVGSKGARTVLIQDLYQSSNSPLSELGIGNLLKRPAQPNEISGWLNQLAAGMSVESIINNLAGTSDFYTQPVVNGTSDVAGTDQAFIDQLYFDLTGQLPTGGQASSATTTLTNGEVAARLHQALVLTASNAYIDNYVNTNFITLLGHSPKPGTLPTWEAQFHNGMTQQQFLTTIMATQDFFTNAPALIGSPMTPPSNTTFIEAVYQVLFNGVPGTPTPTQDELNMWLAKLASGTTRTQMVQTLIATPRYLDAFIANTFAAVFSPYEPGRAASQKEISYWEGQLLSGVTEQTLLATLVASVEFYQDVNAGTGAVTLSDQDTNWVANPSTPNMFTLLTGAEPLPSDAATVLKGLSTGESAVRSALAGQITSSPVFQDYMTTLVYTDLLGRAPKSGEKAMWEGRLSQPSGGPGTLSNDEQLVATILGSAGYFYQQTDANGLHTNVSWVNSLYPSLGLAPNPTGAASTVTNLDNGYQAQRAAVVTAILNSPAYRTVVIKQDYQKYLRRPPTQTEINNALAAYAAGATREQIIAGLMGTPAYFQQAPAQLHTGSQPSNTTFVLLVYQDLFPYFTPSSATIQNWVNLIQSRQMTRQQVALALVTSPRFFFNVTDVGVNHYGLVNAMYNRYLGRDVTSAELTNSPNWEAFFANGGRDEGLLTTLLVTPFYFGQTHLFP
jgi:hypothetical protein